MAASSPPSKRSSPLPAYRGGARPAPGIARHDPGARGVFMGYDFHIGAATPGLIEINTNAGGAMLNAVLGTRSAPAARRSRRSSTARLLRAGARARVRRHVRREWRRPAAPACRSASRSSTTPRAAVPLSRVPALRAAFPPLRHATRRRAARGACVRRQAARRVGPIDLVYNRLTDFSLLERRTRRCARPTWRRAVVTPHPRAHALYADKRNLEPAHRPRSGCAPGASRRDAEILMRGMARTEVVPAAAAERLWSERRSSSSSRRAAMAARPPTAATSSRAGVGGDLAGDYVAQALVPPSERRSAETKR